MASPSLLELTRALATDDGTKAAYRDDPDGFLAARGHGELDPADLATALEHVADALPAPLAVALGAVGDAGTDLGDLLAGLADIDPDQAVADWTALVGDDPDPDALGADPAALDEEPGGLDRVGDADPDVDDGDDQDDDGRPGGFDRVTDADPDRDDPDDERDDGLAFGDGTALDVDDTALDGTALEDTGRPSGFDPADLDRDATDLDDTGWFPDLDEPAGDDPAAPFGAGSADDEPGGFDRFDDGD